MLAIRLQRQGRKGYPVYRVVVQESQLAPTSGRVVAYVGSYNPHTKENNLKTAEIEKYLSNGAQPTPRVVKLLLENKVKLPDWVKKPANDKQGKIRFADKLRRNQPKEDTVQEPVEEQPAEESETTTETNTIPAVVEAEPVKNEEPINETKNN
ncbi:MAG: 30S ribosomal protein S16 [Candidatus Nomurabacteria bacterium]|jgi:small subunit ribosomal protein S16|nr:30S ribosomal protein S16 [Candidatus Nomurabacteria bacterium]